MFGAHPRLFVSANAHHFPFIGYRYLLIPPYDFTDHHFVPTFTGTLEHGNGILAPDNGF